MAQLTEYDSEEKQLGNLERQGAHDHNPNMTDDERREEVEGLENDFADDSVVDDAGTRKSKEPASADEIKSSEETAEGGEAKSDQIGPGFVDTTAKFAAIRTILIGGKKRKGLLIGGGLATGVVGLIIGAFLSLLPLKLIHVVENLQKRFFATSENAIQTETSNMMSNYVKKYVVPSLSKCAGSTIDKNCNTIIGNGTGPVRGLYKAWSQARLENKLADNYGIEFKKIGNDFYLKAPSIPGKDGEKITQFVDGKDASKEAGNLFQQVGRNDLRNSVDNAVQNETKWKGIMYRYKVGRLLEQKYGLKRCVFYCKARDAFADWKDNKVKAAKYLLIEHVITPHSEGLGIALECIVKGDGCASFKGDKGVGGEPLSAYDKKLQDKLDSLAEKYGQEKVDQIITFAAGVTDEGFLKYTIKTIAQQVFAESADKIASGTVNVVQWADTIAQIINTLKQAGTTLKYLGYALLSASMVKMYMSYRSGADEAKSGHADATLIGSLSDTLAPNQQKVSQGNGTFVMGGAGAEGTPLYTSLIDGNQPTTSTAFLDNFLPQKASAANAAASSSNYTCDNGKGVPVGKLICPEEGLVESNFLTGISETLSKPPFSYLTSLTGWWQSVGQYIKGPLNYVTDHISSFIGTLPGIKQLQGGIAGAFQSMANSVVKYILPNPISDNMSGGRSFDLAAGGADVAGNEYAHHGLGGKVLNNQQVTAILQDQEQQDRWQFQQSSFFAKVFDKNSDYSLVTKVAMAMPMNASSGLSNFFTNLMRNPFNTLASAFGSIFSLGRVNAASTPADMCTNGGPFGVTCYGYTSADVPSDPEAFWDQHCQDNNFSDSWNNQATSNLNPDTQQAENNTVNPCLLIQGASGSAGGYEDSSLLSSDDLADVNGSGGQSTTGTPVTGNIYWIGDSLSVGMNGSGGLTQKLTAAGLTATQVEATVGINVASSIPKLQADSANVSSAKTIVVELGTNNCSLGGAPSCMPTAAFADQINSMVSAVRAINPSAQIYWVNMYTTKGNVYQSINDAISQQSSKLNYKVVDWAGEVKSNPSKYSFDSSLGVHQTSGSGYSSMAEFVVGALR